MALAPAGGRKGTVERLKYYLKAGKLKLVARGIYAVVPPVCRLKLISPTPFWLRRQSVPMVFLHITARWSFWGLRIRFGCGTPFMSKIAGARFA